jgi:hypothetical protein
MTNAELIIQKCEEIYTDWRNLLKPPFKITEPIEILKDLCGAAELVFQGDGVGPLKHQTVCEAFDLLDKKLHLVESLDSAIKLPFWLEAFDGPAIHACIDLLIRAIVSTMNGFAIKRPFSSDVESQ